MRLFYGTHSPEMTPYKDTIPKWEAFGVQVLSIYSADGNGYVQDVFEQVRLDPLSQTMSKTKTFD